MKIAIFYVGELRTYETTIKLFKQNVLLNENYHVFSVIQSNGTNDYEKVFKEIIQGNLKKLVDFDKNNTDWVNLRERLLDDINIGENWKSYLRNSGSMIEYYQMYLAYNLMNDYEKENNIKYDFVIRIRVDTIIKQPICLDWMDYNDDTVKRLLYKIKTKYNFNNIISNEVLDVFMNTLLNEKRIDYNKMNVDNVVTSSAFNKLLEFKNEDEDEFIHSLNNYIKGENFIISFRVNVVYVVKRNLMEYIHLLGITYGKNKFDREPSYWFNAECQLKSICVENNIDFFSSVTDLECSSLYEYTKLNYFNENDNLLDNDFDFFIKRN
jgi:hypothetical protein